MRFDLLSTTSFASCILGALAEDASELLVCPEEKRPVLELKDLKLQPLKNRGTMRFSGLVFSRQSVSGKAGISALNGG